MIFFKNLSVLTVIGAILFLSSCANDEAREPFLGTYSVVEDCEGADDVYNIIISKGTSKDAVSISNFYNLGTIEATVSGNTLTYGSHLLLLATINGGTGTLDGDVITFAFSVEGLLGDIDCTATASRQ